MSYVSTQENRNNCTKLKQRIARWGGELIHLTDEQFYYLGGTAGVSVAPFLADVAVHYQNKVIYCVDPLWYNIVHEMGHVFACHDSPAKSNEYAFLGWEYLMARQLKGVEVWLRGNADYGVRTGDDLGTLSREEVDELLADRVQEAKKLGLVRQGRPISIR